MSKRQRRHHHNHNHHNWHETMKPPELTSHKIKKLERELDDLKKQTTSLANFNYAREPEFVRDRLKLRETCDQVAAAVRHATTKLIEPILERLTTLQNELSNDARKHEELSELVAQEFLSGNKGYAEFIDEYISLRKETSKKRILADRLAKEKNELSSNIPKPHQTQQNLHKISPVPSPRRRKRHLQQGAAV